MAADNEAFDELSARHRGTVTSIADGVTGFVRRPGATVRLIAKESQADWQRYTQRVGSTFTETNHLSETLRRGLPGLDRGPGWRSQRAAVDALAHPEAQYAVVAEAGSDGPVTVVAIGVRDNQDLVVLGGGTTFPSVPAGVAADVSLPSGEQAGCAAQYALASIAAQETLTLSHDASPDTWHGPRALEARRMIGANGQTRTTKAAAPAWSAADVRHITEQVTLRQADGRHPFPQVDVAVAAGRGPRRWATELKGWLDRGGSIEVYDHGDPEQRDAAGLAMLELAENSDFLAQNPIPDKSGVRTMVAMADGRPRGLVTAGRNAAGDLHVLRFIGSSDVGAYRATEQMMLTAACRAGGPVSFSPTAAMEYARTEDFSISSYDASNVTYRMRSNLRQLDRPSEDQLLELLEALDAPREPVVDPVTLAASVQRFREAGGDVLFLRTSAPAFIALQERASEAVWAAADAAEGTVSPDAGIVWEALNRQAFGPAADGEGTQLAAVAVLDGKPVAVAGVNDLGSRFELGTLDAVPDADDALVAAVVEGAYQRALPGRPVDMFVARDDERSEQFEALGLQVTGVHPLDDESRIQVRLPDAWRSDVVTADLQTGWRNAARLQMMADALTRFQDNNGSVVRLDHSVAADRQLAEETVREVAGDNLRPQSELPMPEPNGDRVTLVARSEVGGPAYITFDERPDGKTEVVDVAGKGYDYAAPDAVQYAFCDHTARRDQEPVLHARVPEIERAAGIWGAGESRYVVTGMRNRLGGRPSELVRTAPEPTPAAEAKDQARDDQGQSARPRTGGPDTRRRGPMER